MPERQPYTPPTVTRVVLQPTQAVLSLCSTDASTNSDSKTTSCFMDRSGGCKKSSSAPGDSAAQS